MTDCQSVGFCILHCALFIVHFALSSLRGLHCAVCDEHLMHYAQETKLVFMNEKAESENRKPFEKSEKSARCAYACFMTAAALLQTEVSPETEKCFLASHDAYAEIIVCAKKTGLKAAAGKLSFKKIKKACAPVIAERKNGDFILISSAKESRYVICDPMQGAVKTVSERYLSKILSGYFIILGNKKASSGKNRLENPDEFARSKFGFKWFIPAILKFKRQFVCVLAAVFMIQILSVATPLLTQVVVDKVLSHGEMNTLWAISAAIFIVCAYEFALGACKSYLFVHTANRIDVILSGRLFRHLFSLPLKYFESSRTGETIARVRELDRIRSFLTEAPVSSIIDVFFVVVYIAVLFLYSVPLTVIVLGSLPIFALLSLIVTPMFKKNLDEKFRFGADVQSFLVEAVEGIQTVKSFALETGFENRWSDLQAEYVKAGYRASVISQISSLTAFFIQRIADLLILSFGAKNIISGNMTVGQLVAFRMLAGNVSAPVLRFVQLWQEYQQAALSVRRIADIFNTKPEAGSAGMKCASAQINADLRFEDVKFAYDSNSEPVLGGVSFEVKQNRTVGLVGRSGSGKSTIAKLVQRLYVPQSGRITIGGTDISLIDPKFLRENIGVVLQENFMFNATIAENISIHCPQISAEKIVKAAKIAGAHDFITDLERGYDTVIGERGVCLSGGQKQRLAIARAIANDPPILIFDEATSALDYESESAIRKNLGKICENRTVLIIAHRLSSLRAADEIIVIDGGKIAAQGSHDSLLRECDLYFSLYSKGFAGEAG